MPVYFAAHNEDATCCLALITGTRAHNATAYGAFKDRMSSFVQATKNATVSRSDYFHLY